MSIASEITRINTNIAAAYTALDGKGATLPVAGSQNSANLADTIDTITTGGGGSSSGDASFDSLKATIESCDYDDFTFLYQNASYARQYAPVLYGINVHSEFEEIYYLHNTSYDFGYLIPNSATIESTNYSDVYKVTFTDDDEKWIIFAGPANSSTASTLPFIRIAAQESTSNRNELLHSGIALRNTSETTINVSDWYSNFAAYSRMLNLKNFYITGSFDLRGDNKKYLLQSLFLINDYDTYFDNTTMFTKQSSITYSQLGWYPTDDNTTYSSYPSGLLFYWDKFPFVVDLTGATGSYVGKTFFSDVIWTSGKPGLKEIRILLPQNQNVDLRYIRTASTSKNDLILTQNSLDYMAENAPTVSNLTLQLNSYTKYLLTGYSNFVTAMSAKGWTVTPAS